MSAAARTRASHTGPCSAESPANSSSRQVRRNERARNAPWTPDIRQPYSKRQFDGIVKAWRRDLHQWECDHPSAAAAAGGGEERRAEERRNLASLSRCAASFDDFLDDFLAGHGNRTNGPHAGLNPTTVAVACCWTRRGFASPRRFCGLLLVCGGVAPCTAAVACC